MSDAGAPAVASRASVALTDIFLTFLLIGATSFGGGVVAYLRNSLVVSKQWFDEEQFLSLLEISQALPGLNATNMAVVAGDRLRGPAGAVAAFAGITLPGALLVFALGVLYAANHSNPAVNGILHGVAAASVGLLAAVTLQIGHRQFEHLRDIAIVAAVVIMVSVLHLPLPVVLLTVAPVALFLYRPHPAQPLAPDRSGHDNKAAD